MRALVGLFAMLTAVGVARAQPSDSVEALSGRTRQRAMEAVGGCAPGRLIIRVGHALGSDAPNPGGLVTRLLEPTAAALREDARFSVVHLGAFGRDDAQPAAVAGRLGYACMLDAAVRSEAGHVVVELEAWSPAPVERRARYVVRRRLDVALRRFVGFPPTVTGDSVDARFAVMPSRGYVAVAAADLDGDGRVEIVAAFDEGVRVLRLREGRARHRLELLGRAPWPADAPRSATPRRRDFATAQPVGRSVVVRHSDLAAPVAVSFDGARVTTQLATGPCAVARYPVRGGCAQLVDGRDFFDDVLVVEGTSRETAMHFYAFAADRFALRDGGHSNVEALVNPAGRLVLRIEELPPEGDPIAHSAGALGYGTALAMADLELDGAAELLLSHAAPAGAGDQLSLVRASPRGALRVVWRSEVLPGSVWTAGHGDIDNDGLDELFAVEEPQDPRRGRARLWVVQ